MRLPDPIATLACCVCSAWFAGAPARAEFSAAWPAPANAMNPALVLGSADRDPAGLSPYRMPVSRSPAGSFYELPYLRPEPRRTASGWEWSGLVDFGLLGGSAGKRNALFGRYQDLAQGPTLDRFDVQAVQPDQARYVEAAGGGVGRRDRFYGLRFGRYNDYRVSLSFSEVPHLLSGTARPIWQGVGTGSLTLTPAPGIVAGGASPNNAVNAAAVQQLVERTADTELGLVRRTGAARVDVWLGHGWSLSSSYAIERRKGSRAFGGNAGNGDIVEPIDYRTHDLRAGVQFADDLSQFNVALSASLFRNAIDTLTWENPFRHPVGTLRIEGGRHDLVPDNAAYNARLEYARALPSLWRGRITATVDLGTTRQNDRLIPPTVTSGIGAPFGTGFDGNYDRWNTTAALGQQRAHARIDTRLLDLGLSLAPAQGLTVRATLRRYETRNHTRYTAFNPLTGQYGYIIQDTNPSTVFTGTNNVHVRSIPFEGAQDTLRLGGEYRVRRRATLGAELERETFHREHRERARTWEDRVRLAYTDRGFESLTLRLSLEQAERRGSAYDSHPYGAFFTESLPAYTDTLANLLARLQRLEELRKYDLADRRQRVLKARVGYLPRPDLDLGVTLQSRTSEYPAEFGRTGAQSQHTLNLELGYVPTTRTTASAHYSRQWSRLRQAGASDLGSPFEAGCFSLPPSCSAAFGAPRSIYPAERYWSATARERTTSYGLGVRHDFGRPKLELQYTRMSSRSPLGYTFASAGALESPDLAAQAAAGFADLAYELQSLNSELRLPLTRTIALRLYYRHERARVADWHYSGLEQGTVIGNRLYLDAGPGNYRVDVVGAFIQLTL